MIFVFWVVVALIGATIHRWRDKQSRSHERTLEIYLLWWLVVALGLAGMVGGLYHLFDGKDIAEQIGYTRGDGGFQDEVGFGDLAIGTIGFLCIWFRGNFWLAVLIAAAIALWGDAYGHLHQEAVNDNHDPDNTGAVLYYDILVPLIGLVLYALLTRAKGGRSAERAAPQST